MYSDTSMVPTVRSRSRSLPRSHANGINTPRSDAGTSPAAILRSSSFISIPLVQLVEGAMAALDQPRNDIVPPETDGPLERQEDLRRGKHRGLLPADQVEDPRPQPPPTTVQQRTLEGVPNEGHEISRPRAATRVLDVHDRDHCSVPDQDITGSCEIGMDHVRCDSWWWDVGAREPEALDQGRHRGGIPRKSGYGLSEQRLLGRLVDQPADGRFLTGDDPPGERPVVVRLGRLASLEFDDLYQLLDEGPGQLRRGS